MIYIAYFKGSERAKDNVDANTSIGPFRYHTAGVQSFAVMIIILSGFVSFILGNSSLPSVTGPNPAATEADGQNQDEEASNSRGGGIIIIPGGFGNGNNSSSRTGYSSGGSHK